MTPIPFPTMPVYNRTRDEFAMAALTGLLAAQVRRDEMNDLAEGIIDGLVYAETAYTLADAMLKQREAS
jgi:hypothetical protein